LCPKKILVVYEGSGGSILVLHLKDAVTVNNMGSPKNINPRKRGKKALHPAHASYNNYWCLVHNLAWQNLSPKSRLLL
jgi:hypothetical protein